MDLTQRAQELAEKIEDHIVACGSAGAYVPSVIESALRDVQSRANAAEAEVQRLESELLEMLRYLEDEDRMGNLVMYMTDHLKRALRIPQS